MNARIGRFLGVAFGRMGTKTLDRRAGWGERTVGGVTSPSDEAVLGRNELERAAWKYICEGKRSEEWTETQELGLRLVTDIGLMFLHGPCDPDGRIVLRRALEVFRSPDKWTDLRVFSVRAIREHGVLWHQQTHPKDFVAKSLARVLTCYDEEFRHLKDDTDSLQEKLESFDLNPKGKKGKKGAETILAELIVEDRNALDLGPEPGEDDATAIERIRRRLSKDVDDFLKESLEGEKT